MSLSVNGGRDGFPRAAPRARTGRN